MSNEKTYFGKDLEAMSFARNYHKWVLDEFKNYLGDHVAEVGAGMGSFSEYLLDAGIEKLVAFEPSTNMYPSLEGKFSGNDKVETINDYFEGKSQRYSDSFDSICYINVLEHIEDDATALSHAYRALHEKGHVLIFVPALSFLYSKLDNKLGHFRRYTKDQLVEVVSSAGFTVKNVKYFDIAGIIPWYIAFVLLKQTAMQSNVSMYDNIVVPVMSKIERVITPPIGKNLVLVGQKI